MSRGCVIETQKPRGVAPPCLCEPLEGRTLLSTITWENRGSDGFSGVFGANADLARGVVDAALAAWGRVIQNFNYSKPSSNTYTVTVNMQTTGTNLGAVAYLGGFSAVRNGKPRQGTIEIGRGEDTNGDGKGDGDGYFLDPTPTESSEFAGNILNAFAASAQPGSPAAGLGDLYSIVLHEMGHLVGLSNDDRLLLVTSKKCTDTGVADPYGAGTLWAFRGTSIKHLLTTFDSGDGGSALSSPAHSAPPDASATYGGDSYSGANDLMNAYYYDGRRTLIPDTLALILKDTYSYTITLPQTLGTFYSLLKPTGELLIRGGSSNSQDVITLTRSGQSLQVSVDVGKDVAATGTPPGAGDLPAFVSTCDLGQIASINIQSGDGDDSVTISGLGGGGAAWPITINTGNGNDTIALQDMGSATPELSLLMDDSAGRNTLTADSGRLKFQADHGEHLTVRLSGSSQFIFTEAQTLTELHISGNASAAVDASGSKLLTLSQLSIADRGILNLRDNDLVISAGSGAVLKSIQDLIASARNPEHGAPWSGPGLTSTIAPTRPMTCLGIAARPDGSLLVKFTWEGDMDLSGQIDPDDYFLIDEGYIDKSTGYANGDLDYNGRIDPDDYFLIDEAYIGQRGILSAPSAASRAIQAGGKPATTHAPAKRKPARSARLARRHTIR